MAKRTRRPPNGRLQTPARRGLYVSTPCAPGAQRPPDTRIANTTMMSTSKGMSLKANGAPHAPPFRSLRRAGGPARRTATPPAMQCRASSSEGRRTTPLLTMSRSSSEKVCARPPAAGGGVTGGSLERGPPFEARAGGGGGGGVPTPGVGSHSGAYRLRPPAVPTAVMPWCPKPQLLESLCGLHDVMQCN